MAPTEGLTLPPPPPRRRYNMGLFAGGVVAVGGGMALALVGAYLVSSAEDRIYIYCDSTQQPCAYKTDGPRLTGGALLMAGGALVAVAGIPMWFIGSQYVMIPDGERKQPALQPEVSVGAGRASVRFRF
jgi:hypothetical protein